MKICIECKTKKDVLMHHVLPRSAGGTATIPLCSTCHGKIHGITKSKGLIVSQSELTKRGFDKKWIFEYLIIARLLARGRTVAHIYKIIRLVYRLNGMADRQYSKRMHKKRYTRLVWLFETDPDYANFLLFEAEIV